MSEPMPTLARRCFRTSVLFLVLGVLTGLHMSSAVHLGAGEMHSDYLPAHTHVLLVGFLLLAFAGAALWKLPRGTERRERFAEFAYLAVAVGTAARYGFEVASGYHPAHWIHVSVFVASSAQSFGLLLFGWILWPRLR